VTEAARADYCVIGVAECFRGDGEIMANPIGTTPAIGGRRSAIVSRRIRQPPACGSIFRLTRVR